MIKPEQLRKCAMCVYLATEAKVADDISSHLNHAADAITALKAGLRKAIEVMRESTSCLEQIRGLVQDEYKAETPALNELITKAVALLPKLEDLVKEGK